MTKNATSTMVDNTEEESDNLEQLQRLKSPVFSKHLLSIPTDDGKLERIEVGLRDMDAAESIMRENRDVLRKLAR